MVYYFADDTVKNRIEEGVGRLSRPANGELQWSGAGNSEVRKNISMLTFTWYKRQRVEMKASSLV